MATPDIHAEQVSGLKALYEEGIFEWLRISNFSPQ